MDAGTAAAGASVVGGIMGYKGNMAAAKNAQAVANYNTEVAENEAVLLARRTRDNERNLRINAERLEGQQRVMTAKSGVEMSGSPLGALFDTYISTEADAAKIRYAGSIEESNKEAEAALIRAEGGARSSSLKYAAYGSLLTGAQQAATIKA